MTTTPSSSFDGVVEELERQGLLVKKHNEFNRTWFIRGAGILQGYVVTSDELIELKRINRLNIYGIKSLG